MYVFNVYYLYNWVFIVLTKNNFFTQDVFSLIYSILYYNWKNQFVVITTKLISNYYTLNKKKPSHLFQDFLVKKNSLKFYLFKNIDKTILCNKKLYIFKLKMYVI